ncbi:Probable protein phosphatase 2C 46 [Linum perenne]
MKPQIVAVGTCCLVAVICNETLYMANLGDSRAVLGRAVMATGEVLSIQLSDEHNVCHEAVRQELFSLHPKDPHIVVLKHNVWRVKGIIQVRRPYFILNVGCGHSFLFLSANDENKLNNLNLQISKSIGDVYLKKSEFNREPLYAKFRVREPFKRPILSADPSITVHKLLPVDKFVILASDGLWKHLSNQEAVDIVQNHPRNVRTHYKSSLFHVTCIFI